MKMNMVKKVSSGLAALALAGMALVSAPSTAQAEEIQVTGPLAGAPAVRSLRLYRQGRLELTPSVSFTLLDEFRREIFFGLRANYGFTDWLSVGVWGGLSTSMLGANIDTGLTGEIKAVNDQRGCPTSPGTLDCKLMATNISNDFTQQVSSLNWVVAPQVTVVPFRGKIGLFNSAFADADLYLFGGAAFVGVNERGECTGNECTTQESFTPEGRMAIAPTFGLGFTFYLSRWISAGAEYRALPFSMSTAGFDVAGQGPDNAYPDGNFNSEDRQFRFNQMLTLNFSMYFPMEHKISE